MTTPPRNDLSADYVRERLDYDPISGVLTWRDTATIEPRINKRLAGKVAGCPRNPGDYLIIGILGAQYLAHRIAWLHYTGFWPRGLLDHEDRNKQNNRIQNLRDTIQSLNMGNRPKQANNSSGFKGVWFDKATCKWCAGIEFQGRRRFLGRYASPTEASSAYDAAASSVFGEYAHLNAA